MTLDNKLGMTSDITLEMKSDMTSNMALDKTLNMTSNMAIQTIKKAIKKTTPPKPQFTNYSVGFNSLKGPNRSKIIIFTN